jgi:pimeloyl-ACP methyl ester carboxylesterase
MHEQVVQFGSDLELTGVLTKPDNSCKKSSKPGIILLNPGFLHRVGFNRFNTDLGRLLAGLGYPSLRFDLHGLGDSAEYDGCRPYDDQVVIDVKDAIDLLLSMSGTEKCILIGLCSGADYAHMMAVKDHRICGAVFVDGYAYKTPGFYLHDYGPGLLNPLKIVRFCFGKFKVFNKKRSNTTKKKPNKESLIDLYERIFPSQKKVTTEIQQLIDREAELFYIYTGGIPRLFNHKRQFYSMFRSVKFKNKVAYSYVKEADHTFTLISLREKLSTMLLKWIEVKFG